MNNRETFSQHIRKMNESSASLLLLLLLSADILFILLHIINRQTPLLDSRLYRLDIDLSYSEFYQYVKYLWAIILFVIVMSASKIKSYIAWIVVFAFFLGDDAFRVHENLGLIISEIFDLNPPFAMRPRDVGELIVFGSFGILLSVVLAWAYFRGSVVFRKVSNDLLLFIIPLVFVGVLLDAVHAALDLGRLAYLAFVLIEDGGEMVIMSLALWYVFLLTLCKGKPDLYLHDFLRDRLRQRSVLSNYQ
jgi:hypothetical protein